MKPIHLQNEIETAWGLRENLSLEGFYLKVMEINQECSLPLRLAHQSEDELKKIITRKNAGQMIQLLLLNLSMARARHEIEAARFLEQFIETLQNGTGVIPSFRFFSEKGLNRVYQGLRMDALECFVAARNAAKREKSLKNESSALLNMAISLELLDLPHEETYLTLKSLVKKIENLRTNHPGLVSQMDAYEYRQYFKSGEWEKIFDGQNVFGQAAYFKAFVQLLPYHSFSRTAQDEEAKNNLKNLLSEKRASHVKYRIATLQHLSLAQNTEFPREMDWIDRIYLWTWSWLKSQKAEDLERVIQALSERKQWSFTALSHTDAHQLRNALRWIRIFEPRSKTFIETVLVSVHLKNDDTDLPLTLESLLIDLLENKTLGHARFPEKDLVRAIVNHPLQDSRHFYFLELFRAIQDKLERPHPVLGQMFSSIHRAVHQAHKRSAKIRIDCSTSLVVQTIDKVEHKTISEPLCQAFALLYKEETVSFEQFAQKVFGIFRYDAFVHAPKMYNTLNRIKSILNDKESVKTKDGLIYRIGNWDRVSVHENLSHSFVSQWTTLLENLNLEKKSTPSKLSASFVSQILRAEAMTAQDIIDRLKRPRSTVLRYMKSWVAQGILEMRGRGKSTTYHIIAQELFAKEIGDLS